MWTINTIIQTILLGVGATIVMDLYAIFIKKVWHIPSLDYALVGRWFLYLKTGKIIHTPIMNSQSIKAEKFIGWLLHYLIGVIFAFSFILIVGNQWLNNVTFIAPVIFGLMTVIFPFFILQPCFGFGIAASKTPKPNTARIRSILAHFSFGVGLYVIGLISNWGSIL